ncbi:MAG: hypothetical protein J6Z80_05550, partial [Clostridia bacterium]|nr:hypothetical protein [Clostridia bacterium]
TDAVPEDAVPLSAETDPLILVIPSAAVIGFLILFYFIGRSVSAARYRRMSAHDRFMYLTRQNFRFLGHLGFKMEQGETLSEFADRVSGSGREDIRELLGFVPVWETVLYSDREITEEDIGRSESINSALRALVKKRGLRFRLMMIAEP